MSHQTDKFDRRHALRVLGQGAAAAAFLTFGARARAADALDCSKEGTIDDASKKMRETVKYVEKSPHADKMCSGCMLWNAPEKDKKCGGCKLFTGPVNPAGHCLSFAPVQKK